MRYLLVFVFAWWLSGCGGPAQQYILSEPVGAVTHTSRAIAQIGVDKVVVPAYLAGNKIPVQSATGELTFCDSAVWATAPEKGLTRHLITYLQKRFATPDVYRYPWDIEHKNGLRLKVTLNRFVYVKESQSVVLEASYFVESLTGKRRRAKLFATRIPVAKGETPLIVVAMNRAFDKLAADAAATIAHF
jgi:uncharacterized lipoprotein YmbA